MPPNFDIQAFANAWNTQSPERILEFYADDAELLVPPDPEPYRGKEGVRQNIRDVTGGIEDLNGDVEWSLQQGNKVVALVNVTGRHTGDLVVSDEVRIPATNRNLRFHLGVFLEVNDQGKIRREIDLADNMGILMQVGALEGVTPGVGQTRGTTTGAQTGRTR